MRELGITYTAEERRRLGLPQRYQFVKPGPESLRLSDKQRAHLTPAELEALPVSWLMTLADIRLMEER